MDRVETEKIRDELREAASQVIGQAEMAEMIGKSLIGSLEAGGSPGGERQLAEILWKLAGDLSVLASGERQVYDQQDRHTGSNGPKMSSNIRPGVPLRMLLDRQLQSEQLAVVFAGSRNVDGEWLTMAIGVDVTGRKSALGLWPGSTCDPEACREMVVDLASRGLEVPETLLLVTDEGQPLRQAWQARWKQTTVACCQSCWRSAVLSHLPDEVRTDVETTMREAMKLGGREGRILLSRLAEQMRLQHPGAAAELSRGATDGTVIMELGLPAVLRERLAIIGPVRTAFAGALRNTKQDRSARDRVIEGLAAIRTRRLAGHKHLPKLTKSLENHRKVAS